MSNKPDRSKLRYNEVALREAAKRPSLPFDGKRCWYPFEVVEADTIIGETEKTRGDMVITFQAAALSDLKRAGDVTARLRPLMRERFTVPMGNPDFPGHEAPDYSYGLTEGRLLALYDESELARPPHREDGKLIFKGKEIEKSESEEASAEVMKASVMLATDLFFGCEKGKAQLESLRDRELSVNDLKGRLFLGKVGLDKTGEFVNILALRHCDRGLPKDEEWGPAYRGEGAAVPAVEVVARAAKAKKSTKKGAK